MSRQLLRIRSGFAIPQEGTTRLKVYKGGDVVWSDDPIVKGRGECFEPYDPVERATARPGEMRAVKPREQRIAEEKAAKAESKKAAKAESKTESTNEDTAEASESNEGETKGLTLSSLKGSES